VAKSLFTDTYQVSHKGGNVVPHIETGIAWESDKEYKFKRLNKPGVSWDTVQWTDVENGNDPMFIFLEHFIVWMRTAGLPNFRKLWGKIQTDLTPGMYQMLILNKYPVINYEGHKSFVLSTTNALGGKNYFLAICYIVVGALCFIFAIIFLVAYMRKKTSRRTD